jgi:hypothetical protein
VPLVQKSRESNVPAWLMLPIIVCLTCGALYSFSSTSVLNPRSEASTETFVIGPLFMAAGGMSLWQCAVVDRFITHLGLIVHCLCFVGLGLFFISAVVAWFLHACPILNTRDKRRKTVTIMGLVVVSFVLLALMTAIFSTSIAFSISLKQIKISDEQRGNIACFIDQSGSCTRCEEEVDRCPEWTAKDVTQILQNQTKASASLAAIFLVYAGSNLRHAFNLRSHIMNYEIDYV